MELMVTRRRAKTRDERKLHKIPKAHSTLRITRQFSASEMKQIKLGFHPESSDDKWFIFYEKDRLYIHRSWTGYCIYVVYFRRAIRGQEAYEVHTNRNPKQYGLSDD